MMKHYIDENGKVYGYQPAGIEVREMTEAEIQAFRNPPPSLEQKAAAIRAERDRLLVEVVDKALREATYAGQFPSAELTAYRQALLDIPEQPGFPDIVKWPEVPE